MKKYIVSGTSNANFLMQEYSIYDVCESLEEAERRASDLTLDTRSNHFVFEMDIKMVSSATPINKVEVKRIAPPK